MSTARLCLGGPMHGEWVHCDSPSFLTPVRSPQNFALDAALVAAKFPTVEYRVELLRSAGADHKVYCHNVPDVIGAMLKLIKDLQ